LPSGVGEKRCWQRTRGLATDGGRGHAGRLRAGRPSWLAALLSRHFESRVPEEMPRVLRDNWKGGFVLLLIVAVVSSFSTTLPPP
jgi:hypothetical protein